MGDNRTLIITDLHGCCDECRQLLDKMGFREEEDLLINLGDTIDRGPAIYETFEYLHGLKERMGDRCVLIRGNHEQMMLECRYILDEISDDFLIGFTEDMLQSLQRWTANGGDVTMDNLALLSDEQKAAIFDYLEDTPLYEALTVGDRDFVLGKDGKRVFLHGAYGSTAIRQLHQQQRSKKGVKQQQNDQNVVFYF